MDLRETHPAVVVWLVLVGVMGLTYWSQSWGPRGEVSDRNLRNFPPPDLIFQGPPTDPTVVNLINAAPEPMTILLKDAQGKEGRITLPRCESCRYATVQASTCEGETFSYNLPAGHYEATVTFGGNTRGFDSTWVLEPGGQYDQCITAVFGDFPGGPGLDQDYGTTTNTQIDQ